MTEFLTTGEAASLFRVHQTTITRMVADGKLTATRIGRRLLIPRSAIDELVERNMMRARPEPLEPTPRAPRMVPEDRQALRERYPHLDPARRSA